MESYKNETSKLCELPKGHRALLAKWIYKRKENIPEVKNARWKARLVVRGYNQKEGIDFNEVFSPIARHTSIRVLVAFVALFDLELEQFDVKTTFFFGDLEEEIYMRQPECFIVFKKKNHVCRLRKSLYGLKQALQQWYRRFDAFIIGQDYTHCHYDNCVYFQEFGKSCVYLLLYVDDMLIVSKNKSLINNLKQELSNEFEMKRPRCS